MTPTDPTAKPLLPAGLPTASEASAKASAKAGKAGASATDAKLHKVAKQFESVFLSEMLRLARPEDKSTGFSAGQSGGTWQVFLDQALGEAAASKGGTGLGRDIEESLRRSLGKGAHS